MKNILNKRKNAGFTLLELVVVVAVMGLISSMAMDVYTDNSNQKRFEATKERLAEIKFAIIGDPMMRVGSQAVLTGFFNDMGRYPKNLQELTEDLTAQNYPNSGLCITGYVPDDSVINETTCTTASGTWVIEADDKSAWSGPYLHNLQTAVDDNGTPNDASDDVGYIAFADAWGNISHSNNFGWSFYTTNLPTSLVIKSSGLNRSFAPLEPGYEEDKSTTIYATELAYIDNLKSLNTGYCIENSTFEIKPLMDKTACDAVPTTHKWAAFP